MKIDRILFVVFACFALWIPSVARSEVTYANGTTDPVYAYWINDNANVAYKHQDVWIQRSTSCGFFDYADYGVYQVTGCSPTIDGALADAIAKLP